MNILSALDTCSPYKDNWLAGFLYNIFKDNLFWVKSDTKTFPKNQVIVIDDECVCTQSTENFCKIEKNQILITNSPKRYTELVDHGIKAVLIEFEDWLFNTIPLRRIKTKPELPKKKFNKVYNCLNRRWSSERQSLIEHLIICGLDAYGCITANEFSYYGERFADKNFQSWYKSVTNRVEYNNYYIEDIPVSCNTKNLFYIAQNVPGNISLQIETFANPQEFHFLTEKSMVAVCTGQVPILIGAECKHLHNYLRAQGFDVYDDIVDHKYDQEQDSLTRIKQCVDLNSNLLRSGFDIDITDRALYNQNYLLYDWTDKILTKLVNDVLEQME